MFRSRFRMVPACPGCGLSFERAQGYFGYFVLWLAVEWALNPAP